ncbi:hypothetical protein CSPAE12_11345 [Colletotrichum incanum]|nr:hypothetical protein CSPAE12_11345 [Colletotrichum incanum]
MAQSRDLPVMPKSLTIGKWARVLPMMCFFQELGSLSLVFKEGLDASAANFLTRYLLKLRNIASMEASVPHTPALASFFLPSEARSAADFQLLQFLIHPLVKMHRSLELRNLTGLTLSSNFTAARLTQTVFKDWAASYRGTYPCENPRNLHLFRFPDLIPAIADLLPRLHLDRLHVFSTGLYGDSCRELRKQKFKYLFLAECRSIDSVADSFGRRDGHAGSSGLEPAYIFRSRQRELEHISRHMPKLQTISFVSGQEQNSTWALRALEPFRRLISLTVPGQTTIPSQEILWIDYTQCYLGPGGFSLSLLTQDSRSWFRVHLKDQNYYADIWGGACGGALAAEGFGALPTISGVDGEHRHMHYLQ